MNTVREFVTKIMDFEPTTRQFYNSWSKKWNQVIYKISLN